MSNDTLQDWSDEAYRTAVAATADMLRQAANDLERVAQDTKSGYGMAAARAVHQVTWGVANARMDSLVKAAADADAARTKAKGETR